MNQKTSFYQYVSETHHKNIIDELDKQFESQQSGAFKPVTVRLHPDIIQTVDNIAEFLGVSRQKLLSEAIDGGVSTALQAIAESEAYARAERQDKTDEEMKKFIEEIRTQFIKELVA